MNDVETVAALERRHARRVTIIGAGNWLVVIAIFLFVDDALGLDREHIPIMFTLFGLALASERWRIALNYW